MTEKSSSFPFQAWRLFRNKSKPTLQDLFALRPRPNPYSRLDASALAALVIHIFDCEPIGTDRSCIIESWVNGPGM